MTPLKSRLSILRVVSILAMLSAPVCAAADVEAEYSRITVAGGQSQSASFTVDDSVTIAFSGGVQSGDTFSVTGIKDSPEPMEVTDWHSYQE